MEKSPALYAKHIIEELDFLDHVAKNFTVESFLTSDLAFRAVAYSIQTISEAVRKLPDDWLARHASINWRAIRGIGNIIRHEYAYLDKAMLWEVTVHHAPQMREAVATLYSKG